MSNQASIQDEFLQSLLKDKTPASVYLGAIKSEVQHLDSYKVLPWKNNINSYSLKSD